MNLQELAKKEIPWISDSGTVLSSRTRLARNIRGFSFPIRCKKMEQSEIFKRIVEMLEKKRIIENHVAVILNDQNKTDRLTLMERHLISHEMASNENGEPGVIFSADEKISVMVNEEDHLRIQAITPGLSIDASVAAASLVDDLLEEEIHFSYSGKFGYLTSCPTNAGTGLRVSCLMHLFGLARKNEIEKLVKWLEKSSIGARGFYGEGTKPLGDIFQISNLTTLGRSEEQIACNFKEIIGAIVNYEKKAQESLTREEKVKITDEIWRSYGILKYSKLIASEEAVLHLTKLRSGIILGLDLGINPADLNQAIFRIQPGHLQAIAGKELSSFNRDVMRAMLIHTTIFKEMN